MLRCWRSLCAFKQTDSNRVCPWGGTFEGWVPHVFACLLLLAEEPELPCCSSENLFARCKSEMVAFADDGFSSIAQVPE